MSPKLKPAWSVVEDENTGQRSLVSAMDLVATRSGDAR